MTDKKPLHSGNDSYRWILLILAILLLLVLKYLTSEENKILINTLGLVLMLDMFILCIWDYRVEKRKGNWFKWVPFSRVFIFGALLVAMILIILY